MLPEPLFLKQHDLQPYYKVEVRDSDDQIIDLTSANIVCTMASADGTIKIDRQSTGIQITDAAAGEFEYRWQAGDTDTTGLFYIEFEITPPVGGKFTVPTREKAEVRIMKSLDGQ